MEKKVVRYIYITKYYSAIQKNRSKSHICNNMDGPWGHYAKLKNSRQKEIIYDLTNVDSLKKKKKNS